MSEQKAAGKPIRRHRQPDDRQVRNVADQLLAGHTASLSRCCTWWHGREQREQRDGNAREFHYELPQVVANGHMKTDVPTALAVFSATTVA